MTAFTARVSWRNLNLDLDLNLDLNLDLDLDLDLHPLLLPSAESRDEDEEAEQDQEGNRLLLRLGRRLRLLSAGEGRFSQTLFGLLAKPFVH